MLLTAHTWRLSNPFCSPCLQDTRWPLYRFSPSPQTLTPTHSGHNFGYTVRMLPSFHHLTAQETQPALCAQNFQTRVRPLWKLSSKTKALNLLGWEWFQELLMRICPGPWLPTSCLSTLYCLSKACLSLCQGQSNALKLANCLNFTKGTAQLTGKK